MSLPTTGHFEADFLGARVVFDGSVWTSQAERFEEVFGPDLAAETARQQGHHITADVVARRVLDKVLPGWTEVSFTADTWPDELPSHAED